MNVKDLPHHAIVIALAVAVDQALEPPVFIVIAPLEKAASDLAAKQKCLVGIHHLEVGGQAHEMKMPPQQAGAKCVQRADLRLVDQSKLLVQPLRRRIGSPPAQGRGDARPHFIGRGIGEGHDKQIVHVAGRLGVAH